MSVLVGGLVSRIGDDLESCAVDDGFASLVLAPFVDDLCSRADLAEVAPLLLARSSAISHGIFLLETFLFDVRVEVDAFSASARYVPVTCFTLRLLLLDALFTASFPVSSSLANL